MYFDIKDLQISCKCYKCGRTYYRSNRDNGKCSVYLQDEDEEVST